VLSCFRCEEDASALTFGEVIDTLSDVLRAVRLSGAVFFSIDASAPWVAETPPARQLGPLIMPRFEHVIEFHFVTSGSCWGAVVGESATKLEAGDIIVFPQGDAHVLSSKPGMRGGPDVEAATRASKGRVPVSISLDGGGEERAKIICGFLGCDARPFHPLLATLPRVIHVKGEESSALRSLGELALAESSAPRPGGDTALSRLSELLFIEVVRGYLASLPSDETGWVAGLRDDVVGRALRKIHEGPAHPWTLDKLAKEVGASRSLLAERFAHFVGVPPITYLSQWRIQLAASLLRTEKASLAEIATRVGYGSEAALSRAFKRSIGVAPAVYRRGGDSRGTMVPTRLR
jgi:AraC-like DNA-binding protein